MYQIKTRVNLCKKNNFPRARISKIGVQPISCKHREKEIVELRDKDKVDVETLPALRGTLKNRLDYLTLCCTYLNFEFMAHNYA